MVTGNSLAEGASTALAKLLAKFYQNTGLGYDTYTKLYQACVTPIMDYCSGVWGYTQSKELDNNHFRAPIFFLGVNKYAPKLGIEGDMGWISPDVKRKMEMIRFWNRVIGIDNDRLPKIVYNDMTKYGHPWLYEIRNIFV